MSFLKCNRETTAQLYERLYTVLGYLPSDYPNKKTHLVGIEFLKLLENVKTHTITVSGSGIYFQ